MKYLILMGSPRKNGNTASLLPDLTAELQFAGADVECVWLSEKTIQPCTSCRSCQKTSDGFGCPIQDDMADLFERVLRSDCLILATPIYSWYCTAPMKAMLDRLVYGMNKFYGDEKTEPIGTCLWSGKSVAVLTTCGYRPEKGSDLFFEGMKRYCKHSQLNYLGDLALRNSGYQLPFLDEEKIRSVRAFAQVILPSSLR